jgi:hypothetical protein
MRRLLTGSLVLSVGIVPVLLVQPVLPRLTAAKPHPVATSESSISLGDFASPAAGVRAVMVKPDDSALSDDSQQRLKNALGHVSAPNVLRESAAGSTALHAITIHREVTRGFSAVGVTWRNDPAVGAVSIAVRAKDTHGKWSSGITSDAPDAQGRNGVGRRGAEMLWTGPSVGVDITVTPVTGAPPRDLKVDLIDPGTSAADADPDGAQPTARADAGLARPAYYGRASWGADERMMTWPPDYTPTLKAAVLHHTVNTNSYTAAEVPAMIRAIYHYHAISHGWGDIGYNAIVDRFGRLWEGRYGGFARSVIGAHAGGFNSYTAGISMLGDFSSIDVPAAMRETIARYISWKFSFWGIDPNGTTVLTGGPNTRYDHVVTIRVPTIFPHRQTSLTACPGEGGMRALPWIRSRVKQLMGAWASPTGMHANPATFDPATATWHFITRDVHYGNPGDTPIAMDTDGDGNKEMGTFRDGIWQMMNRPSIHFGSAGDVPTPGYFVTYSQQTYSFWRPSNGTWYVFGRPITSIGHPGDIAVPADYNGDGVTDMAVFQPSTATWTIQGQAPFVFGHPGDIPVAGDFNHDGKAEPTVFTQSTATWSARGLWTTTYGTAGDIPVPMRWSNDDATDVVVWRPSTATWYAQWHGGAVTHGPSNQIPVVFD